MDFKVSHNILRTNSENYAEYRIGSLWDDVSLKSGQIIRVQNGKVAFPGTKQYYFSVCEIYFQLLITSENNRFIEHSYNPVTRFTTTVIDSETRISHKVVPSLWEMSEGNPNCSLQGWRLNYSTEMKAMKNYYLLINLLPIINTLLYSLLLLFPVNVHSSISTQEDYFSRVRVILQTSLPREYKLFELFYW